MKKLTAGVFAGILTIVTVNAANADIATTNYVKGAIESLDGNVDGTTGIVKEISQTDGKITATRGLITDQDVDAISQDKVTGLTDALDAKQTKDNIVNADADDNFATGDYDSTTKYPSMKAAQKIAAMATADVVGDVTALQTAVDKLNDTNPETEGSVANKIATAIAGLDGAVTGTGVVKEISQTDGKVTAVLSAVSKDDLDDDLSAEIGAKMTEEAYNTATTMAADGEYAKKDNSVGVNLTALDTQVKSNAAAIAELTGDGEGSIDSLQDSINDLENNKANAADVYTKTDIDGKVGVINESIDGKVTAIDLNKKLLTTNTEGQLVDAAAGLPKPAECSNPDVSCMLVNDGGAFKWEKIVDTYTVSAN